MSVLIGMSVAYAASLMGMILAWVSYRRRRKKAAPRREEGRDE
jgi:membrane associated rhomboid family serine protease